jgi:hypothetical protein
VTREFSLFCFFNLASFIARAFMRGMKSQPANRRMPVRPLRHSPVCSDQRWVNRCLSIGLLLVAPVVAQAQQISPALADALEAARLNRATRGQQALLFQNNDVINQAALHGWIPDATYQAAQREYARLNQVMASSAAQAEGAGFTVQESKTATYSPGTDSDYIVTTTSSDPVGQIQRMQEHYNDFVNSYLADALESEGHAFTPRRDWHNRLDVDFMADPEFVTDEQFRKIAELNNDAYRRRGAAEYERRSRSADTPPVTADQFADYAAEMQDFIEYKQRKLERFRKDPSLLTDPTELAEMHRLMAQESKYTDRIESAVQKLREQEGLGARPIEKGPPVYEMTVNANGEATLRKRPVGTVATRGARRSRVNRASTFAASALADNSVNRAVADLSEAMAEAAQKNPTQWGSAPEQIAEITRRMPPEAKGQLLERIRNRLAPPAAELGPDTSPLERTRLRQAEHAARVQADNFARQVASEMRTKGRPEGRPKTKDPSLSEMLRTEKSPSLATRTDQALRGALGISDDLSEMSNLRRTLNQRATQALGQLDRLGKVGTAAELASAAQQASTYISSLQAAMDPNLSDAEADQHFQQAHDAAIGLAQAGALGALAEAVPTVGAVMGGWAIGHDGTRWLLENTETGRQIDRGAEEFFNRHQQARERAMDSLVEYFGGESQRLAEENQRLDLEASYWEALREGKIQLKDGTRTVDIAARIRDGDLIGVHELIEPGPDASQALIERLTTPRPASERPSASLAQTPAPSRSIDEIEWENQTFDVAGDQQQMDDFYELLGQGNSPIGPAERDPGQGGLPLSDSLLDSGEFPSENDDAAPATANSSSQPPALASEEENLRLQDLFDRPTDLLTEGTAGSGAPADADLSSLLSADSSSGENRDQGPQLDDLLNASETTAAGKMGQTFDMDDLNTFDMEDLLTAPSPNELKTADGVADLLNPGQRSGQRQPENYRSRAERLAGHGSADIETYRNRARELHQRLVAREAQRQAAIEAQRREAARQQELARQQEIWRQQQLAHQQEMWRRQQLALQQQAMRQQQIWLQQQALQQQALRQQWGGWTNNWSPVSGDGSIMGREGAAIYAAQRAREWPAEQRAAAEWAARRAAERGR